MRKKNAVCQMLGSKAKYGGHPAAAVSEVGCQYTCTDIGVPGFGLRNTALACVGPASNVAVRFEPTRAGFEGCW